MRDIKIYTENLFRAIDLELSRSYGFGCVTYECSGSHKDMNYRTFEKSAIAIIDGLHEIEWSKINNFTDLKKAGIKVENCMFNATNGINTHKGLIFLQMFISFAFVKDIKWDNLTHFIKELANPLLYDYKEIEKAIIWDKNGLRDIRYYPLSGFTDIITIADYLAENVVSDIDLTLYLIANTDDTTTIQRSDLKTLRLVQDRANEILMETDSRTKNQNIEKLNKFYIENSLSSGGIADLFTTIRTLEFVRDHFYA